MPARGALLDLPWSGNGTNYFGNSFVFSYRIGSGSSYAEKEAVHWELEVAVASVSVRGSANFLTGNLLLWQLLS